MYAIRSYYDVNGLRRTRPIERNNRSLSLRVRCARCCVITSYSIHYTKLYDTRNTMAVNRGMQDREVERTPKSRLSSDRRLQLACVKSESLRITSYNVCYTKLLRKALGWYEGFKNRLMWHMKVQNHGLTTPEFLGNVIDRIGTGVRIR